MVREPLGKWLVTRIGVTLLVLCTVLAHANNKGHDGDESTIASVALAGLPPEGRQTYELIWRGGPFPYAKDGVVFGNREHLLPSRVRGYYHEYTVPTPGASNRGARRIACGGPRRQPEVCYYTDDHYASFRRIEP